MRRKEEKFLITVIILTSLFVINDIGHRAYDWCQTYFNTSFEDKVATDTIKHNNESNKKQVVIPVQKVQKQYPELEKVSDEEQLHGLDKFALERVSSNDSNRFEKQTVYTVVGNGNNGITPINAAQIERVWAPPMDKPSNVKVIFTVMDDGTMKDVMLASSSGIPEADNAALLAINNAETKPFKIQNRHYVDISMWFQVGNFK